MKFLTTMAIIIQAHRLLDDIDAEDLYQDLLLTDMRLPLVNSVIGWGYQMGLLPG